MSASGPDLHGQALGHVTEDAIAQDPIGARVALERIRFHGGRALPRTNLRRCITEWDWEQD